ncbi:hypothetical protein EI94DRAFT_1705983 [Lactarius quietus]|nr:hypothetical protein EI94DRAFT_1705983 [Lactarius quietus]
MTKLMLVGLGHNGIVMNNLFVTCFHQRFPTGFGDGGYGELEHEVPMAMVVLVSMALIKEKWGNAYHAMMADIYSRQTPLTWLPLPQQWKLILRQLSDIQHMDSSFGLLYPGFGQITLHILFFTPIGFIWII